MLKFLFLKVFILFAFPFLSQANNKNSTYTCKVDNECLTHLKEELLNKDSKDSFYNLCKYAHSTYKNCCSNPESCKGNYGREVVQDLNSNSGSLVKDSGDSFQNCQLSNLSNLSNILSNTQGELCSQGVENCEIDCDNELLNFKKTFKDCFNINHPHTINSVLKESKSNNSACFKEIKEISRKFKDQTLNKGSFFKEDITHEDIVRCDEIEKERSRDNLNSLVLNVCERAKGQQEQQEQMTGNQQEQLGPRDHLNYLQFEEPKIQKTERQIEEEKARVERAEAKKREIENPKVLSDFDKLNDKQKRDFLKNKYQHLKPYEQEAIGNSEKISRWSIADREKQEEEIAEAKRIEEESRLSYKAKKLGTKVLGGLSSIGNLAGSGVNKVASLFSKDSKAQANSPSFILNQMVYQSVVAPQIEPLKEQELQKPENPVFTSYDLVKEKSAGVLVEIKKNKNFNDEHKKFVLKMIIQKHEEVKQSKQEIQCLNGEDLKKSDCSFSLKDFKENDNLKKFITLPMKNNEILGEEQNNTKIIIKLVEQNETNIGIDNIISQVNFYVNIIETQNLLLGLTRIGDKGTKNSCYNGSDRSKWLDFFKDTDQMPQILNMYPLSDLDQKSLVYGHIKTDEGNDYIKGNCILPFLGLLVDIANLEEYRHTDPFMIKHNSKIYDRKIVALVSKEYFSYHFSIINFFKGIFRENNLNVAGLVVRPWAFGIVGSYNVTFLVDNQDLKINNQELEIETKNYSTLSHELGHTFKQSREYYDEDEKCKTFNGGDKENCYDYRMEQSLKIFPRFSWRKNALSIMSVSALLNNVWIDRETYQKSFKTLSDNYKKSKDLKVGPAISFSGVYDPNGGFTGENKYFYSPKIKSHKKAIITPKSTNGDVKIQLEHNGKIIYETRFSSEESQKTKIEVLFDKKGGRTLDIKYLPISVVMEIPYLDGAYSIIITKDGQRIFYGGISL